MYSKEIDLNTYINCLWNYFQSYNKSIKTNLSNQEAKWLKILERSKLKLDEANISKLLRDPNNIFKIVKLYDLEINQIQILKLRYFIVLYWLNYLVISVNKTKKTNLFSFNNSLLTNWSDTMDELISTFESRSEIMISERDKIYENLKELEKIRLKCPKLDTIHQTRLESQLKALRYILNIDVIDDLRNLSSKVKDLNSDKFDILNNILEGADLFEKNMKEFLELYEHISNELLLRHYDTEVKIFKIHREHFNTLVRSNLNYQLELEKYKDIIYNTNSLTWRILDDIKVIELDINLKNTKMSKFLISKSDKLCHLIYKIILQYNSTIFDKYSMDDYINLQKDILLAKDNLRKLKDENYNIINDLEKQFSYSDLKDLDLEFYYQFLININSLIHSMTKSKELYIDSKKYMVNNVQSSEIDDRRNFNSMVKNLSASFVSKQEFDDKLSRIERRMIKVEDNKSNYIMGTMVISLISLYIWKRIVNFKQTH